MALTKNERRLRIKKRIRGKISGTAECPRLTVFRSNKSIYAQLIDDVAGHTLAAAHCGDKSLAGFKGNKTEAAKEVGKLIGKVASEKGIRKVVFDRSGYVYHGRVKAVADGARESGLEF